MIWCFFQRISDKGMKIPYLLKAEAVIESASSFVRLGHRQGDALQSGLAGIFEKGP